MRPVFGFGFGFGFGSCAAARGDAVAEFGHAPVVRLECFRRGLAVGAACSGLAVGRSSHASDAKCLTLRRKVSRLRRAIHRMVSVATWIITTATHDSTGFRSDSPVICGL